MTLFDNFKKEFDHLKTIQEYIELIDDELDRRKYEISTNQMLTNKHCYSFFEHFTTAEVEQFKIYIASSKNIKPKDKYVLNYDCSITKRKGCNYCMRDKSIPLSNEDYSVYVDIVDNETKRLEINFGNCDVGNALGCYVPINYCPICGREL